MIYLKMNPLPQSPLLVHPEREDSVRLVRPGTLLPTLPQGPSPLLPRVPEAPSIMPSRGPVVLDGVEDTFSRITKYQMAGWANVEITKALLAAGVPQTEITEAFQLLSGDSIKNVVKRITYYRAAGWADVDITKALLAANATQAEITEAFQLLVPKPLIDKPAVRAALWVTGIGIVAGAGYLVVRRIRR